MFVPRTTLSLVVAGLALSLTACSALTRPDEITIVAEPLASPETEAPPAAVAAAPGMAAPPGAKQGGG